MMAATTPAQTNSFRATIRSSNKSEARAQELVQKLLPVIRRLAGSLVRRLPSSVTMDDLVGAGCLALVELARREDATDEMIERVAVMRLRGAMLDEMRRLDPLSRRTRTRAKRIARAAHEAEQAFGRAATREEVAKRARLSLDDYDSTLRVAQPPIDLTSMDDLGDDAPLSACPVASPEEHASRSDRARRVQTAVERLPERHRKALELYYGDDLTLREIGARMGVTEARICQLMSDSARRLRQECQSIPPPAAH